MKTGPASGAVNLISSLKKKYIEKILAALAATESEIIHRSKHLKAFLSLNVNHANIYSNGNST